MIAGVVVESLRRAGDMFHYDVAWSNPGKEPGSGFDEDLAEPHILQLDTEAKLIERVRRSVDPNGGIGGTIRSIATCRAVTFGFDGQAFMCLRHEDPMPVAPDPAWVIVEERRELLGESDYFDGWLREGS